MLQRHPSIFISIALVIAVLSLSGVAAGSASFARILFYLFLGFVTLSLVLGPILIRRR